MDGARRKRWWRVAAVAVVTGAAAGVGAFGVSRRAAAEPIPAPLVPGSLARPADEPPAWTRSAVPPPAPKPAAPAAPAVPPAPAVNWMPAPVPTVFAPAPAARPEPAPAAPTASTSLKWEAVPPAVPAAAPPTPAAPTALLTIPPAPATPSVPAAPAAPVVPVASAIPAAPPSPAPVADSVLRQARDQAGFAITPPPAAATPPAPVVPPLTLPTAPPAAPPPALTLPDPPPARTPRASEGAPAGVAPIDLPPIPAPSGMDRPLIPPAGGVQPAGVIPAPVTAVANPPKPATPVAPPPKPAKPAAAPPLFPPADELPFPAKPPELALPPAPKLSDVPPPAQPAKSAKSALPASPAAPDFSLQPAPPPLTFKPDVPPPLPKAVPPAAGKDPVTATPVSRPAGRPWEPPTGAAPPTLPGDTTMIPNLKTAAVAAMIGGALAATPAKVRAEADPADVAALKSDLTTVKAQMKELLEAIKGKKDEAGVILPTDPGLVARMKELSDKVSSLETQMGNLRKDYQSLKTTAPGGTSTPAADLIQPGRGRVRLVNQYPVEISMVVNGTAYRVDANKSLDVDVAAGNFRYQLLQSGAAETNSTIREKEIVTLRIK